MGSGKTCSRPHIHPPPWFLPSPPSFPIPSLPGTTRFCLLFAFYPISRRFLVFAILYRKMSAKSYFLHQNHPEDNQWLREFPLCENRNYCLTGFYIRLGKSRNNPVRDLKTSPYMVLRMNPLHSSTWIYFPKRSRRMPTFRFQTIPVPLRNFYRSFRAKAQFFYIEDPWEGCKASNYIRFSLPRMVGY